MVGARRQYNTAISYNTAIALHTVHRPQKALIPRSIQVRSIGLCNNASKIMVNGHLFLIQAAQQALWEAPSRRLGRSSAAMKACNFCGSCPASSPKSSNLGLAAVLCLTLTMAWAHSPPGSAVQGFDGSLRLSFQLLLTFPLCSIQTTAWAHSVVEYPAQKREQWQQHMMNKSIHMIWLLAGCTAHPQYALCLPIP
jgi:hypothetical protein